MALRLELGLGLGVGLGGRMRYFNANAVTTNGNDGCHEEQQAQSNRKWRIKTNRAKRKEML